LPHIFYALDWTVALYIVMHGQVLMCHHKKIGLWLPIGGHIEINETVLAALHRETDEETGLEVEILAEVPPQLEPDITPMPRPRFVDVHPITPTHSHQCLIYVAKPKNPDQPPRLSDEHLELRWMNSEMLRDMADQGLTRKSVAYYGQVAIQEAA